ncbi:hypothetical protein [Furfurilactobacillus rossiae]
MGAVLAHQGVWDELRDVFWLEVELKTAIFSRLKRFSRNGVAGRRNGHAASSMSQPQSTQILNMYFQP